MSAGSPFQPKVLAALAAGLVALFAASLLLTGAGGQKVTGNRIGANSYSHSAIGHLGFYEVLRKLGRRVVRSDSDPLAAIGRDGVLVLAEPNDLGSEEGARKLLSVQRVLVVLPKWNVVRDDNRDDWIGKAVPLPTVRPQSVLFAAAGQGDIARVEKPASFTKVLRTPDPTVEGQLQLIKNSKLKPLISTADGVLLGEFREGNRIVWVLADPDPVENHGLGKGDNIAFVEAVVSGLFGGRPGALVFDETSHGFRRALPNALTFLFDFPFNLLIVHVLAGSVLLLFASMGRFGIPEIAPRALANGKKELVGNAASLLDHAGHHATMLKRYAAMVLQETGRLLRAPANMRDGDLAVWLDRQAKARGVATKARDLLGRIATTGSTNLSALLGEARAIHRWKKDMIHGISRRLGDH